MFNAPNDLTETFTNGDCWVLAQEIEKQYGFPLIAVLDDVTLDLIEEEGEENFNFAYDGGWTHVMNLLPDGSLMDIKGIYRTEMEIHYMMENYMGYTTHQVSSQELSLSVKDAQIERISTDGEVEQALSYISAGMKSLLSAAA